MVRIWIQLASLALTTMTLMTVAAEAQEISRTTTGTLSWSGTTFSNASMIYGGAEDWGPRAFYDPSYPISLFDNFQNLSFFDSGGMTVTPPAPPYSNPVHVILSNSGAAGSWGWSYTTAATTTGTEALTLGTLGRLATLNFLAGGNASPANAIDFYVDVFVPGSWTTEGTGTGDYEFNGVAAGFSTPTFIYNPGTGVTTVYTYNLDYTGGAVNLNFTLIGAAVPEPSTWAMILVGFAGFLQTRPFHSQTAFWRRSRPARPRSSSLAARCATPK